MCADNRCSLVCSGCGATEEAETFLDAYEQAQEAGWGQTACGLLLCAACVQRVTRRAAMIANAHLN